MSSQAALSLLSRYEALFELFENVNTSAEIEAAGQVLAGRLKYVADVFSWRYLRVEPDGPEPGSHESTALVVDGHRGKATVQRVPVSALCGLELELWNTHRARTLEADELEVVRSTLPASFQKPDIVQAYVCPRFGADGLEGMFLFSKRRQPFNDLDTKFLTLVAQIFHDKVHVLREQRKRRELETAYLEQEIMLRQSEKLATLGRLSAGIAHEVNNPIAAALRNAKQLASQLQDWERGLEGLAQLGLSGEQRTLLEVHRVRAMELARQPLALNAVAASDLESHVEDWLGSHGVEDGWRVAATLVAMGFDPAKLSELAQSFAPEHLSPVLTALAQFYSAHESLENIRASTERVSRIVSALRSYSYLDQAPIQKIDVREGLEDTLAMLHDKLGSITVRKDFAAEVPPIEAYGRELNQVWTHIIDNAVQAMDGHGELSLRSYAEGPWVVVEITDNGPGVSAEIQDRIFDPFFTTKPPGEGTGLGLNVSHNVVVQKHGGSLDVRSEPGATCFRVRLPLTLAADDSTPRARGS
jgi:signal transduction histidine kinase